MQRLLKFIILWHTSQVFYSQPAPQTPSAQLQASSFQHWSTYDDVTLIWDYDGCYINSPDHKGLLI